MPSPATPTRHDLAALIPGIMLCLVAALLAVRISTWVPALSPLLVTILLGIIVANVTTLPARFTTGIAFTAKPLLRAGIVLLGLQVALGDLLTLGPALLLVAVTVVIVGMLGTRSLGTLLHVPSHLTTLIAAGFSICGAAAVAATTSVTDPDGEREEDAATALALVVLFGTLMIGAVPLIAGIIDLPPRTTGLWAGASTHEVAQVVAIGGILGGGSILTLAVLMKLARVLMLAPVIAVISVAARRRPPHNLDSHDAGTLRTTPALRGSAPLIPWFVVGFLGAVLLRSFVPLPQVALDVAGVLQTFLLAAAMCALGLGVKVRSLAAVGPRPVLLAALSTVLVATTAAVGLWIAV